MKTSKQFLSVFLALMMIFSIIPMTSIEAEATGGVKSRIDSFISSYPSGSRWTGSFDGGIQCYGFGKMVIYNIFGKASSGAYRTWTYSASSTTGMNVIGSITSFSSSNVKSLLSNAKCGDVLQFNTTKQHTMIVYSVDSSGVTIYDCNWDNNCGIDKRYCSFGTWSGRNSTKLTLLRADNYAEIDGIEPHQVDSNYGTNFTAYPKAKITAENIFDANHNMISSSAWIGTSDECTIHEVYTDGCCKVSYPLDDGGTKTVYSKISLFNMPHTHSYSTTEWEAAHPHKIYVKCSCGDWYYTGDNKILSSCSSCWTATWTLSQSSISVKVGASASFTLSISGVWPDTKTSEIDWDTDLFGLTQSGNTFTVTGKKAGTGSIRMYIYSDSSKSVLISSKTIPVTVSSGTYTLSYNDGAGEGAPSSQSGSTSYTISSTVPTRFGYTFMGWSTNFAAWATVEYEPGDTITLTADKTLYAVWEPAKEISAEQLCQPYIDFANQEYYYSFTPSSSGKYEIQSYCDIDAKVYVYDSSGNLLGEDDDDGCYNGLGLRDFYLSLNLTAGTQYYIKVRAYNTTTGSICFWISQMDTYTISYNANGGTGAPSSQIKVEGETLTLSSTIPTRTGYTFLGWSTDSTATSATYSAGGSLTLDYNTTLYAVWKANTYTVKYNANGGSGTMSNSSHTYDVSKSLTSNAFTRSGYTFLGWSTSASATSATYTNGQSVKNLTATNGGTVNLYAVWKSDSSSITADSSYSANISTGGEVKYYTFTPSSSGKYVIYSTSSEDTKVILYNSSGTELDSNDDGGSGNNFRLEYDLTAGTTYRFGVKYWSSSKTGTIPFTFGRVYNVTYYANGGTGAPSSAEADYGATFTLSSTMPTRSGYTFLGWSKSSSATSATYEPGDDITVTSNTTLYAVWSKNPTTSYTLSYSANGGTGAPSSQTGSTSYTISNTVPTRSGYTFLGWSKSSSATSATYEPGDTITISSNTTLYAVWTTDSSTLVANSTYSATISNGGEVKYYTFTPSSSGKYVIYSTSSEDTKVILYNSSGTELDSNDDGGSGNNFRLEYNLTAGTTYRFGVRYYNSSKTGTIPFTFGRVYNVTYYANGGTGAPSSQSKDYGATLILSSTVPTRTGYTFLGWSTSSTATSATYSAGGTFTSNANTSLYAVWKANESSEPSNSYGFEIQQPSRTTIRHKDGIKLHTNIDGTAPAGSYVVWTASNSKFKTEEINNGNSLKIISNSNGKTTFTATLYSADGEVLATDSIEMTSKAGFFDKIGGFFRSLFGTTKIYEN